jgi:hypothetical protein
MRLRKLTSTLGGYRLEAETITVLAGSTPTKGSLKNKVYKMDVVRYSVAGARLYGDGEEGESSGD